MQAKPERFGPRLTGTSTLAQADKLNTIITAAKIQDVEPIWATLFTKVRPRAYPDFEED